MINAHGERFIKFDVAKVVDFHCDPARVGGEKKYLGSEALRDRRQALPERRLTKYSARKR